MSNVVEEAVVEPVPKGWVKIKVGDFLTLEYGKSLPKKDRNSSGEVPVYSSSGATGYHSEPLNSTACIVIGRKGAAGEVHLSKVPCWTIDTAYYVEPPRGIDLAYLFYNLKTLNLNTLDKSTAIPSLSRDDAYAADILIAPSNEQKRIVEKLELLLSELDKATQALQAAQEKLKNYRRAVLKAAVEGELSRAWREENKEGLEPAERLLERILAERRRKWEGTYKAPVEPKNGRADRIPEAWCNATLDQLTHQVTSGSRGWAEYYADEGAIFIRAQNINKDRLDLSDVAFVNLPGGVEGRRTRVHKGDLLITITGANVTKSAFVEVELDEAYVNQHVALVRPSFTQLSPYLYAYVVSPEHGRRHLEDAAYGAGKPGLNLTNIKELEVALPPEEEQCYIVEAINRQFSVADGLEEVIKLKLQQSESLRQSLLKKAFSGLLVPQDPNDEPASVLLERIRAEREAATAGGKGKRGEAKGSTAAEQPKLFGG